MKNLIYILVLLSQVAFAQSKFAQANDLYRKGNYTEAATAYEAILAEKKESPELYYNLGNAYYKLDKVAPAIYNYEKALLLNPNYRDAKVNLAYANKMTADHIKPALKAGFGQFLNRFTSSYHYDSWAWGAVACAFLFLGGFVGYYFSATTLLKRIFFGSMMVVLAGIVLSIFAAVYIRASQSAQHPAIVFDEVISVKAEPNANADDAFLLHEGTRVNVLDKLDNWKKIQLADDTQGWIPAKAIRELNP